MRIAPYGSWESPFAFDLLTRGAVRLGEPSVDGEALWWLEGRPADGGRSTLVRRDPDGTVRDVSPPGMNVRDRVHEYGGGAYAARAGVVVASSFADGRLYRLRAADRTAEPITPEGAWRYADLRLDLERGLVLAVREDHTGPGEPRNELVAVPLEGGTPRVLARGADFYAAPRPSPDGRRLAWLEWNHPNMPWDGTTLRVAELDGDGRPRGEPATVAGGPDDWIAQPAWSPGGVLHFVAEPTGWMNLYRWVDGRIEPVAPMAAELAGPDWQLGARSYAFLGERTIVAAARSGGRDRLYRIAPDGVAEIATPFTELAWVSARGDRITCRAAGPTTVAALVAIDPAGGAIETMRSQADWWPDLAELSVGRPVEFPTGDGRTAHGVFYAPVNRAFRAPDGELPPLLVTSHGGPTASASTGLSVGVQLWTSRGVAVLDVDYGGSTGYGRDYRRRLDGAWGVVDVDDCVAGARWLAGQGLVDAGRMAIEGASASGYTTLAALAFRDVFAAGISAYGLGDLAGFARDTHKFESRYLDRLVGPWPAARATYEARSPALHAGRIRVPVLIMQGLDDHVVPPAEAERIVAALRERGVPHAYLPFEGEDHGFRRAATIVRAAEATCSFLGQVLGFEPADPIERLPIEGFDGRAAAGGEPAAGPPAVSG